MDIKRDDLTGTAVIQLLQDHLNDMHAASPPESVHALDLSGLRRPEVSFWTIWQGDALAGCGALKALDAAHAEIKSMRTAPAFRRQGVATQMLAHLIAQAQHRGFQRLSLETGSTPFFTPAHQLYQRHGFSVCGPFGDYTEDPFSVFMTLALR